MTDAFGWLRFSKANAQPAVRLLCFAHAGAGASSFNGWRRELPAWIELVRVQLPGHEDRSDCSLFTSMDALIPALFPAVATLLDRPLVFYGHSVGALIAFELARELRRRGLSLPIAMVISSRRAPHRSLPTSRAMHNLPETELIERLQRLGGIPAGLLNNRRWRDYYLPVIRADLCLSDVYTYREEPALDCPLHTFLGRKDCLVVPEDWEAWSEVAAGEFSRQHLACGHFFDKAEQAELIAKLTDVVTKGLLRGDDVEMLPAARRT
jgi:medium-chain acyl-[acyl-carrier-protein] hydrolase